MTEPKRYLQIRHRDTLEVEGQVDITHRTQKQVETLVAQMNYRCRNKDYEVVQSTDAEGQPR